MIKFNLSTLLEQKRMSQADLARLADIRPSTICDMYHNNSAFIKLEHLASICRVLECDVSDVLLLQSDK